MSYEFTKLSDVPVVDSFPVGANTIIETNAGSSFLVKEKYSDVLSKIYSECNNERLIREIVGNN